MKNNNTYTIVWEKYIRMAYFTKKNLEIIYSNGLKVSINADKDLLKSVFSTLVWNKSGVCYGINKLNKLSNPLFYSSLVNLIYVDCVENNLSLVYSDGLSIKILLDCADLTSIFKKIKKKLSISFEDCDFSKLRKSEIIL